MSCFAKDMKASFTAFVALGFALVLALPASSSAASARSWVSTQVPKQGDVVAVRILKSDLKPTWASFMGQDVPFAPYAGGYIGFLPIGPTIKPGAYPFTAVLGDGGFMLRTMWVTKKNFPYFDLGIPEDSGIASPQDLIDKLALEKKHLDSLLSVTSTLPAFAEPFVSPVSEVKITSVFGEVRRTGDQEIRHLGVDYGGSVGVPISAMNAGTVSEAYVDTVYGNSIVIDHGQGVFTLYLHLDTMEVKTGDRVARGQKIGTMGKTGYATGPHLHLSLKIRGVPADPLTLLKLPI